MSRGGWRKRANEGDGWGGRGGYMVAKVQKLEEQFKLDAPRQQQKEGTSSSLFNGVAIYVNGYTDPTADELRRLMMLHGGQYHVYYSRSKTTHIIATNLPNNKIKELKGEKVVRPEWITDSIKAGCLLSYIPYQLYTMQSSVQKGLNFTAVCRREEPTPGPSNIAKELNNRVNGAVWKQDRRKNEVKVNGVNGWKEEEAKEENYCDHFEMMEFEQVLSRTKQNGIQYSKDNAAIFNGHTCSPNSALKTQELAKLFGNGVADKVSSGLVLGEKDADRDSNGLRDCYKQHFNNSRVSDTVCTPDRTISAASSSSPHTAIKTNGAYCSTIQGPSSAKSTSQPSPSKAASSPSKPADSNFISEFYSHSRLHHISTWKCEFTEFVNSLQRKNYSMFSGREKLRKIKAGGGTSVLSPDGNNGVDPPPRHQNCIMHVDMDCFFVSVGIRDRPDLKGKPVAVTSNRGRGRTSLRPGANLQFEMEFYQKKLMKSKAERKVPDKLDSSTWENPDSAQMNGADLDLSASSMAEIASCSYEARQAGIKNGMFFGQAKQLCPNLEAVPYNFHAYKEVALTMYETLASYTHDIEAVSCDEALVDVTEILAETGLTPDEAASVIRCEIKEKTKCSASIGMGSNILLARMATRKAKPDGQYYLKPEAVDDFIRDQLVTNLPGVGRSMEYKLATLGVKTCGDLQQICMGKLQREFGPKTGQTLYRFCRGLDDRPIRMEKERKSVSAEINYGIRFTQTKEADAFLLNLSEEIQRRLEAAGMKGKRLTLKIMVRKAGAPLEPAKFGGHGICDSIARTVTLDHATDSAKVIGREALNMFHMMKLNISDVRGVGIQMHQLVPLTKSSSVTARHSPAQPSGAAGSSRSVLDLFQVQNLKKPIENKPQGALQSAVCLELSSTSGNCSILSSSKTCLTFDLNLRTSGAESTARYNGLHTPVNVKSRLNVSIEVPSPSQIDPSVLEALPPDIREQVEQTCSVRQEQTHTNKCRKENMNGFVTGQTPGSVGTVILQIPELLEHNSSPGAIMALPSLSQVDPEVFAALPMELQEELRAVYDQRPRQAESTTNKASVGNSITRNPLLQLKHATAKTKKRSRKKTQGSPLKKVQSPMKNKLLSSLTKNSPIVPGSPQKLITASLKCEEMAADKQQDDPGPCSSSHLDLPVSQSKLSNCPPQQGPNLAGAVEFADIKTLLKEWVTTISDPMEEDILQVVKYCTDLVEEKDLEKLDLVIKYMKRLMQQSVESVWNMAFDFILDNVQVVLQQTYGSTLKMT
uniref:DNA repair protein REV1 n=1 Tax=Latimeria chalumnae TaxID=7897 RepID=H3AQM6_LATCH